MPGLQVRDIPEGIYRRLVDAAERQHRSLTQQAVATLARGLGMDEDDTSRRRRVLERIGNRQRRIESRRWADPAELVRADRSR